MTRYNKTILFSETVQYLGTTLEAYEEYGEIIARIHACDLREAFSEELDEARREIRKLYSVATNDAERDLFVHGNHKSMTEWNAAAHRYLNNAFVNNELTANAFLSNEMQTSAQIVKCIKALDDLRNILRKASTFEHLRESEARIKNDIVTINVFVNEERLRLSGGAA